MSFTNQIETRIQSTVNISSGAKGNLIHGFLN